MATVFLSYDHEDAAQAATIASALERHGHSVWSDQLIRGGTQYGTEIEGALELSDAVVVLWSENSVQSAWVRDEAAAGRELGKLIPVSLDKTKPPMGFRQYQTIDVSGWKGGGRVPKLDALLGAIEALDRKGAAAIPPPEKKDRGEWRRRTLSIAVAAIAVIAVAAALFLWRPWGRGSATPVLAVVAAKQSPGANELARDLLVQLGSLQATNPDALTLVHSLSDKPDLILEVSGSSQPQEATASLILLGGKDRALLWSKNYKQPSNRQADLRQQIAFSAAKVVQCAAKADNAERKLNEGIRKLYLNGCAEFADSVGTEFSAVVPIFEQVTRKVPKFRDAWAKLLLAESNLATVTRLMAGSNTNVVRSLRRHIAEAHKRHGEMPEILLAELELLPEGAYAERLKLVDRATQLEPENADAHAARAGELLRVGRMNDAVFDAERASQLDPLSPATRNGYVSTLAYSGRLTRAAEAVGEAERLWPGASSVLDAKYRFHLRYGDPAVALELHRTRGTLRLHELTILARIDRTPENIERAVQIATAALNQFGEVGVYAQILAEFGREEEVYATLANWKRPMVIQGTDILFRPTLKKFRQDPRFMVLAKRLGLLDYWRKSGKWPDFCFDPDLPYDCKQEATKLT